MVRAGASVAQIAEILGRGHNTVLRFMARKGLRTRRAQDPQWRRRFDNSTSEQIASRYAAGESSSSLAQQYQCSVWAIREAVRRLDGAILPRGNRYRAFSDTERQQLIDRWERGESQAAIASAMHSSQATIGRVLASMGYRKEHRRPVGERHGSWRGGRFVVHGYVHVRVERSGPFGSMCNRMGYVLEHRLIVAESIGRPLRRSETVHHINGNKTDNRIENLELRHGQHGAGVAYRCRDCGSHNVEPVELGAS